MALALSADPSDLVAVATPLSVPVSLFDAAHVHGDGQREGQTVQDMDNAAKRVLTPPTSDDAGERVEKDVQMKEEEEEEEEDIGDVEPAEYWDGGRIPIFRPVGWTEDVWDVWAIGWRYSNGC